MKKNNYQKVAKDVIQKEIDGLKKLKLHCKYLYQDYNSFVAYTCCRRKSLVY